MKTEIKSDSSSTSHSLATRFLSFDQKMGPLIRDMNSSTSSDPVVMLAKKLEHNATERVRRKNMSELNALLRSLIPSTRNNKKKVSVPRIINGAIEYILELKKEIYALIHKKEVAIKVCESCMVSSVNVLYEEPSKGQVVIQLITPIADVKKNKKTCMLSEALRYLDEKENGLVLLNVTAFRVFGEERFLNTLQFKIQGNQNIDAETLKEELCYIERS